MHEIIPNIPQSRAATATGFFVSENVAEGALKFSPQISNILTAKTTVAIAITPDVIIIAGVLKSAFSLVFLPKKMYVAKIKTPKIRIKFDTVISVLLL